MNEDLDEELIRSFLNDMLTEEENNEINKKCKDEDFTNKLSEEIVFLHGRNELREKLNIIREKVNKIEEKSTYPLINKTRYKKKKQRNTVLSIIAAGIAAIITLNISNTPLDRLYTKNYTTFQVIPNHRGANTTVSDTDLYLYADNQFAVFIDKKEISIRNKTATNLDKFYLALAYMEKDNSSKSIPLLENIPKAFPFYKESMWYLGLAYLKQENSLKAKKVFIEISKQFPNWKRKKVNTLIKSIK